MTPETPSSDNDTPTAGIAAVDTRAQGGGGIPSFQSPYLKSRHPPWSHHYLDYPRLLDLLRSLSAEVLVNNADANIDTIDPRRKSITATSLPSHHPTQIFVEELDDEIDRIALFVLKQQGSIADQLLMLQELYDGNAAAAGGGDGGGGDTGGEKGSSSGSGLAISSILDPQQLHDASHQLHHLLQYLRTNILAIDKLLSVHDRLIGLETGVKIEHAFLNGNIGRERILMKRQGRGRLDVTYRHTGTTALVGLAETVYYKWRQYVRSARDLNRTYSKFHEHHLTTNAGAGGDVEQQQEQEDEEEEREFLPMSREMSMISMLPASDHGYGSTSTSTTTTTSTAAVAVPTGTDLADALLASPTTKRRVNERMIRDVFLRIELALSQLSRTSSFVERWALTSGIEGGADDEDDGGGYDPDDSAGIVRRMKIRRKRRKANKSKDVSSNLNLINSFLYMVSYYMVAPTSGTYAERLGLSPSMSGAIIGFTAFAALASTFLYSWWTSHSYKDALVFSSICCLVGNVLYGMGLPYDSLTLVLVGRFLNGFGSARAINRRFIADAFSNAERTAASAAFVASSAAGMSFGPALSALVPFIVSKDSLWWREENAPAWIVAVLWGVFLFVHIVYFEDPPKPGKKRDSRNGGGGGISQPLVPNGNGSTNGTSSLKEQSKSHQDEEPLWKRPVCLITIYLVFLLKAVLELVLSSASPIAGYYFGWSTSMTGWYLAIGNGLVLPAISLVTYLSRYFQDRQLILLSLMGMLVGSLVVIHYAPHGYAYPPVQYIFGTCLLFITPNVMEAPSMSLLSKNIPESLRKGIFNLGFFTTEAGFGGRVVADSFLTMMGSSGIDGLVNNLYGSLAIVNACTLALIYANYDELVEPHYHDD